MRTILVTFQNENQPDAEDVEKLVDIIRAAEPTATVTFGFLYSST